jgi:putative phage-type endonuclease
MITKTFENREDWLAARRGKITGTRVKDLIVKRGTGKKKAYYELIAERLAVEPDTEETPMDRGTRLEAEGVQKFIETTGKEVDTSLVIWERDDNSSIAISPDGFIGKTEAVEMKCLSSASHIEAWLTQEIPDEYKDQALQYFVCSDELETLYVCFYDPRIPCKEFFWIEMNRESVKDEVSEYLKYEQDTLTEINNIVANLSGF